MMSRKLRHSLFIGIDLVEFKKARSFYQTHKRDLGSYFTKQEIAYIRKDQTPHKRLAVLLAAKEAVFKSLELPWMGPAGFKKIAVVSKRGLLPDLSVQTTKKYAVVCCHPSVN